jgi:hypothetical protein
LPPREEVLVEQQRAKLATREPLIADLRQNRFGCGRHCVQLRTHQKGVFAIWMGVNTSISEAL